MSLSTLYRLKLKQKKHVENEDRTGHVEDAETLKAKLEKIAIPPEIAKQWQANPCMKPC